MRSRTLPPALLALATLLVAACGSSSAGTTRGTTGGPPAPPGSSGRAPRGSGPVDVFYAGSLVGLVEQQLGPAFHAATGYRLEGFAGGSSALAAQIRGKVRQADVFVSASPAVDATLEGPANGSWVSWYATFATAPLVLGYNPKSHFAAALRTMPWYRVVAEPGFRLGRTDPATDPKGTLAIEALTHAASAEHLPALAALAHQTSGVYPEETLVGRLQSGQLDAGFFYSSEARAAGIPSVALAGSDLGATYTATVVARAPHPEGAAAFVAYLLGAARPTLAADGFHLPSRPAFTGKGIPAAVRGGGR